MVTRMGFKPLSGKQWNASVGESQRRPLLFLKCFLTNRAKMLPTMFYERLDTKTLQNAALNTPN